SPRKSVVPTPLGRKARLTAGGSRDSFLARILIMFRFAQSKRWHSEELIQKQVTSAFAAWQGANEEISGGLCVELHVSESATYRRPGRPHNRSCLRPGTEGCSGSHRF